MNTKNYSISEVELDASEAKNIVIKLIDAQINTYRLQSLQDWEKNRTVGEKWQVEIDKLIDCKKRLKEDLDSYENASDLLKINLSLHLDKVNQQEIRKVG